MTTTIDLKVRPAAAVTDDVPNFTCDQLADDEVVAEWIAMLLGAVPSGVDPGRLGLVNELDLDAVCGGEIARRLRIAAALVHPEADERWTAGYLLRHRDELATGVRNPASLLRAARYAAEMRVRRVAQRETPLPTVIDGVCDGGMASLNDAPPVADLVVAFVEETLRPYGISDDLSAVVRDAVVVTLEVAERHRACNGSGPSVLAMRPDARPAARLVTHLRAAFAEPALARVMARLLLGGDGTAIDTGLLWWVAHRAEVDTLPDVTLRRWRRDLDAAEGLMTTHVA